jgi:Na+/proline symporter/nitrogen-specific signal transduction histidine kinase
MLHAPVIVAVAFAYLCLLFAVAYYADKRADARRSVVASPYVYALSIAVYCTAWTFYGSVGRASTGGADFLPIYLGPMLVAILWWLVLRKILRISKLNRITSIADFVASRYGKSQLLGGLVTIIAVIVIMPYIALQLKGVSTSFNALLAAPELAAGGARGAPVLGDTAFYVAVLMAVFAMLYGTRHIDATERHEGMVAAIAFESIVKLVAFLTVGLFVTFVAFDGFGDLFSRAAERPEIKKLFTRTGEGYGSWVTLTLLSMAAFLFLPRQFQVAVVENVDERHLRKAAWLVPLYLLLINVFVLPIAVAGLLTFPGGGVDTDTFVLAVPIANGASGLALLGFIGGLSAATGMVIVETIALSTMVCNELVMPLLLRWHGLRLGERGDLTRLLIAIRRWSIVFLLLLGYGYYHFIGGSYALVSIGLLSFAAMAQFAPAIIGGIYWKGATRAGALAGLSAGFVIWLYTLLFPSFARSGWLPMSFIEAGPWGIALLRPYALFGLTGWDNFSHSLFWSMVANLGLYVGISLTTRQSAIERIQATRFVEVFRQGEPGDRLKLWRGSATYEDLHELAARFIGKARADQSFSDYAQRRRLALSRQLPADADLVSFTERLLAGAIGAASARVMVASVVKGENLRIEEVMQILDEASHVIEYSRQLEQKSQELEAASAELRAANIRLREIDQLKDEFIATVTHELRTPLTSIRSFSEILHDNPGLAGERRAEFLGIIIKESERLTRLINQVLDLARLEAGRFDWQIGAIDFAALAREALAATSQLFKDRRVALEAELPDGLPQVHGDRDQMMQVVLNLLSNAVKFSPERLGSVSVRLVRLAGGLELQVRDNGPGLAPEHHTLVFEKFRQVADTMSGKPAGSGLGLAISRRIVEHLGGRIRVDSTPGRGATFAVFLPFAEAEAELAAAS